MEDMIRIVNLKGFKGQDEVLFKIDRSTPVGNPFPMYGEGQRNMVCDKYAEYFKEAVNKPSIAFYLADMLTELRKGNKIALGCWCYPKRCHAETIKKWLLENKNF